MAGLGGLAGMGAAFGGYQEAEGTDLQNRVRALALQKGQYDFGAQSGADAALARAFPNILSGVPGIGGLGGVGQGPQGGPPIAPAGAAAPTPPPAAPPMGGSPASATPPPGGGPTDPFAQRFGPPIIRRPEMAAAYQGQPYGGPYNAVQGQPMGAPPQRPAPPPAPPPQMPPQPPQPPGMPGMGPQPGMMDWRGAFKSIIAANPGAQPGAIIGAMDKLVQLMNPIERAQWAEQRAMFSQMMAMANFGLREEKYRTEKQQQEDESKNIVDGMEKGVTPPTLVGLYRMRPYVEAEAAKRGLNLSQLQLQWNQAMKQISALNSPRQAQFIGLARSAVDTIGELRTLAQSEGMGRLVDLNRLQLEAKARTGDPLAVKYIEAATALRDEMATIANQGYAPTESAWKQAYSLVTGEYGVKALNAQIDELEKILNFRISAYKELSGGYGMASGNRYMGTSPIPTVGAGSDTGGWSGAPSGY